MVNRLKETECSAGDNIRGEFRHFEADLHVTLRAEIIDLVRAKIVEQRGERTAIGQVGVVQEKPGSGFMRVLVDVVEPACIQRRRTAFDPVNFIAFR
jgi:hypothetical protein